MDNFQDQLFEMIGRLRQNGLNQTKSKAASTTAAPVIKTPCNMIVSENPNRIENSKAASSTTTQQEYQTVVKKCDMGGSSTGEAVYQCGTHDFETKSLKEFNEHLARLPHDGSGSGKAASVTRENKVKVIADFLNSKHY
jgi:CCR4-NOT transcriptional regulation complex NOT5 subunit